ncbi:MAG: enoyl-CoA hydratase/isomerase family protein [bacterium]|nr:enoyl-CoA hydratase/isomerase family protein [bacterium]
MAGEEHVRVEVAEGLATITLNRPPLNVLNLAMMAEFNTLLETVLANEDLAAVVIRAQGKAFCAGVDVADHTAEKVGEMIGQFHGIFRKLASTDALTIAVVQGAALGGGCELACFCDIVLASDRAKFGQPEVQVGVFAPVAACALPQRVGLAKATELVALGATIKADEAHRIGLVNQLFGAEEFDARVAGYLDAVRQLSRPVVRVAKRAVVHADRCITGLAGSARTLAHLDEAEKLYLDELMKLDDAQEGIAAFLEKRAPVWTHG